jgi:hypothetical protein
MSTEYDTYMKLKQIPYDDLKKQVCEMSDDEWFNISTDNKLVQEYLESRGWTVEEFISAFKKNI